MKQVITFLCLLVLSVGLNSCSKSNDPAPTPAAVGTWKLDRVRTGGFVAPYTAYNADNDPLTIFGIQDNFTVKNDNDKTFTGTFRSNGTISDYNGNWDYTNTTLTLKYSQGDTDTFTLDDTKTPVQLLGSVVNASDTLTNPTTKQLEVVKYTVQLIYSKQ